MTSEKASALRSLSEELGEQEARFSCCSESSMGTTDSTNAEEDGDDGGDTLSENLDASRRVPKMDSEERRRRAREREMRIKERKRNSGILIVPRRSPNLSVSLEKVSLLLELQNALL